MMNRTLRWSSPALVALAIGCGSTAETRPLEGGGGDGGYALRAEQLEGCECDSVCPCVFSQDASGDQCRALMLWNVEDGWHGSTALDGLTFGLAITKMGKNIEETAGAWEGTLLLPAGATPAQRRALEAIARERYGPAFARLDAREAPIEYKRDGERRMARVGGIGRLEVTPLMGANGEPTEVLNPPSPLMIPRFRCARADVHTFDDGTDRWDFSGKNAFYGPIEMKPKR